MAHTVAAALGGAFAPSSSLASSADLQSVKLSKNISNIHSHLQHFNKPDEELLNDIMRSIFQGIAGAFEKAEQESSKLNDCHSSCLLQLRELNPSIQGFTKLYEMYDKGKKLQAMRDDKISHIQSIFQHHKNTHKSSGALSKPFQELWPIIEEAKSHEFARFFAFQEDMAAKANWIQSITENASLFSRPACIMSTPYASPFLNFCDAVFSGKKEAALAIYPNLPQTLQQHFKMDQDRDENITQMQNTLEKIILPSIIEQLNDRDLFFGLLWKVARDEKVGIETWDRHWAENNWKTQLDTFPHRILLALCCYESRQLNQTLNKVWDDLLKETNISVYDQWPICSRLLHTIKNSAYFIDFLMKEKKQGIHEYSSTSLCIQEVVKELTIRTSIYNSICSFQKEIPSCCSIISPLKTQLRNIGEALITHPLQLGTDQKIKLENATRIFLKLPGNVVEERCSAGDVNCLTELVVAVFLSDFCDAPSEETHFSQELIEEVISKIDASSINSQLYPIHSSKGDFFFFPCSIQTAARMEVAAKIGAVFALPISKMALVNYRPLDIKKKLKGIIKQWSTITLRDSIIQPQTFDQYASGVSRPFRSGSAELSSFSGAEERPPLADGESLPFEGEVLQIFVKQLEALPDPFAVQIKDFIGCCITGNSVDDNGDGERYLKEIPNLPAVQAKERVKEILAFVKEYSSSPKFENAHRLFYQSHLPLTGLLFPYFQREQDVSKVSQQKAKFPTTFKHLWSLFNLITGKPNDSSQLLFYTTQDDNEIFQFIEISNYFSSTSFSIEESEMTAPIMQPLLEILVAGQVFEKVRTHLRFQVGLASEPIKEAQKRLDIIKASIEGALENNAIITPNMLISKIQAQKNT